ncbi:hypothetical protein DEQ92_20845, partial [Haloferax sp. Atlit-6N]
GGVADDLPGTGGSSDSDNDDDDGDEYRNDPRRNPDNRDGDGVPADEENDSGGELPGNSGSVTPTPDPSGGDSSDSSDSSSGDDDLPDDSVTRDRGSAGASPSGGGPTAGLGSDSDSDSASSIEDDPRQEIENWAGSDQDGDGEISWDEAGVEGGGRVPGSGVEDFAGADADRSEQGIERISETDDTRRARLAEQAEQFEQEVLRSLPSGFDEGDVRITEEQQNGQTGLAAEFTQSGEYERAEQFEQNIIEQSSIEDESDVRVVERDGRFAARFTNEGQEQIIAESLGVDRTDIAVQDGQVVGTSEEGRNALAMAQPRDRQNPTRADDEHSDRGGISPFGTPN